MEQHQIQMWKDFKCSSLNLNVKYASKEVVTAFFQTSYLQMLYADEGREVFLGLNSLVEVPF